MVVYKATNTITGQVYIGQTVQPLNSRIAQHKSQTKKGRGTKFGNSMRKYGHQCFAFEVLEQCGSIDELNYLETYYIKHFDSVANGLNIDGGGNNKSQSLEARLRMSKIQKGRKHTAEHREKLALAIRKPIKDSNGTIYAGVRAAARQLGIKHHTHIMRVLSGERKKHRGLSFSYINQGEV